MRRRRLRGLRARLLAFNLLLVIVPVAGLLFLDAFERRLLADQERTMVEQARILSAALAERGPLRRTRVAEILERLGGRSEARLRVVDREGQVLGDSSRPAVGSPGAASLPAARPGGPGWLYRLGAWPFRAARRLFGASDARLRPAGAEATGDRLAGREVRAALAGRYGAASRLSEGQPSVTLYSAVPIRSGGQVVGAVLVSRSTLGILQTLYALRLRVLAVFGVSVGLAVLLSLLLSRTIARPLRRLRDQASRALGPGGRLEGRFDLGRPRRDEIGELARALERLRCRLHDHGVYMQRFGADVAHELKNPLAAIRSAAETLGECSEPADREHFRRMIESDVARMERVLADVREASGLDAPVAERAEAFDLRALVEGVVAARRARGDRGLSLDAGAAALPVEGVSTRLARALDNVLENAEGFSGRAGGVRVELRRRAARAELRVLDRGPGVPEEHRERIFARFFSYRPGTPAAEHAGLGLAIARGILEAAGGGIRVEARPGGGACFELWLPLAAGEAETRAAARTTRFARRVPGPASLATTP